MKRLMIISTTVAFCGGIGTMMAASSCDPECINDRRTSVYLELEAAKGEDWDPQRHPTTVSYVVRSIGNEDSNFEGTFGADPEPRPGRCLDMKCDQFALGFDEPGLYEIEVEVCGKAFKTTVDVPMDLDACHVESQGVTMALDDSGCRSAAVPRDMAPEDDGHIRECDPLEVAHPSVFVMVANPQGDVMNPVDVESVWYTVKPHTDVHPGDDTLTARAGIDPTDEEDLNRFRAKQPPGDPEPVDDIRDPANSQPDGKHHEHDEDCDHDDDDDDDDDDNDNDDGAELERHQAFCIADADGTGCRAWIAGFDTEGEFTVGTTYCGVEVQQTIVVEKELLACHVQTEYVVLDVETTGCLQTPTEEPADPDPSAPTEREAYGG